MKRGAIVLLTALMLMIAATALAYDETSFGAENTPQEIVDFLAEGRWSGYTVTGWVDAGTTRAGAVEAFVAVKDTRDRKRNDLLAFRRNPDTGAFVYCWHNAAALPQVEEPILLSHWGDGGGTPRFESCFVLDGEIDEAACFWMQDADGCWRLQQMFVYTLPNLMFIHTQREGVIHMTNAGWVDGPETDVNIYGTYQRDLRYFSFAAFPRTVADAREKLSNPPDIPGGTLSAQQVQFTSGKRYPVYQGPGEAYGRAGNGKASVSTNDWIQVFGWEDGWIMIQYDITSDHMRIGWIEDSALPRGKTVPELTYAPVSAWLRHDASLTDDPLYSRASIVQLAQGSWVTWLATMGDWAYVESSTGDLIRGFVPAGMLNTQRVIRLEDCPTVSGGDNRMRGTLTTDKDGWLRLAVASQTLPLPAAYYVVMDEISGEKLLDALPQAGFFVGEGRTQATALLICPVYADGTVDRENAVSVQW